MTPYWNLYCSCRKEIAAAAAAGDGTAAITLAADISAEEIPTENFRHESSRQRREDHLEERLERHCEPLHGDKHAMAGSNPTARCVGVKRPREMLGRECADSEREENTERDAVDAKRDECLGLVAHAFAEELDLLRKDEHFGGSARDIAAMADMMRCLTDGFDATEQQLFLEKATR